MIYNLNLNNKNICIIVFNVTKILIKHKLYFKKKDNMLNAMDIVYNVKKCVWNIIL